MAILGPNLIEGTSGNDVLIGTPGDDVFKGLAGADTMTGETGDDSYYVDNPGDKAIETAGGGNDTVYSSVDYTLAAGQSLETLRAYGTAAGLVLMGNGFDNSIFGGDGDDTLSGAAGNDRLNGGAGVDTMAGGVGDDIYYVDNAGDKVMEDAGGGTDTVYASVSFSLAAGQEVELLRANSAGGIALTGNEFDNFIIGGAGNDTLSGGGGNDILDGRAGIDTMTGGAGNDTYYVDNTGDVVNEDVGGGTDTIYTSVNYTLAAGQEIEFLRAFNAPAGLTLRGNDLDNALFGGAGDDTLESGGGNDKLYGGDGNDSIGTTGTSAFIYGGFGDDSIRLDGSSTATGVADGGVGSDTVHSTDLGQFTIRNVETLDTYYGYLNATVAQVSSFLHITAVLADPDMQIQLSLRGAGGTLDLTTMISGQNSVQIRDAGLTSAIRITGSTNGDVMFGTSFADTFQGGEGKDTLFGGDGNDTLVGGADDDVLYGGLGNDKLTGGSGADTFVFDSPFGPGVSIDLVADFTAGTDTIQLDNTYFHGLTAGQLSAAQFSSTGHATAAGPQIVYDSSNGALYYDANGTDAGGVTRFATLTSKPTVTAADFMVTQPLPP